MNLHTLKNNKGARKRSKRVGRGEGSGLGKTSGRGHKGQMSRTGSTHKPGFEGGQMRLVRRIPKRGFKNPCRVEYIPVNLSVLSAFDEGAVVDLDAMKAAGLANGSGAGVKILGNGELDRKLTVKAKAFSATAKAKIEAAGGTCETV